MRLRKWLPVLTLVVCFILGLGFGTVSFAAKALPPGVVIGDAEGVYSSPEGEYYIDLDNILPGEVYEKQITIRSLDVEEPFSLGLLVEPVSSTGSIKWEDHIDVTLTLDGKELYQGPLLGDGSFDWVKTPLTLGVCKYGSDQILDAVFTIDKNLSLEEFKEDSELKFYWTFVATKDQPVDPVRPTTPTTSSEPAPVPSESSRPSLPSTVGVPTETPTDSGKRLPQTGEQLVYMFMSGLLLVLIALFLWKKRREEEQG